jgi:hypothetical protein
MIDRGDPKSVLHHYLRVARDAVLWKLDGVSEYDVRRPLVPTGTNLLGLVKHLASVESGYFGEVFGRPFPEPLPWLDGEADPTADMWASPQESRDEIVGLYRRVAAHSDETIDALPLDAPGRVPWWGDDGDVTLQLVLVHMTTETHRHAGHADIVRELIDGSVGHRAAVSNLPDEEPAWWTAQHAKIESAARIAAGLDSGAPPV